MRPHQGGETGGMFWDVKPGEPCSSYICLMVAAAALAKPRSALPANDPAREVCCGCLGPRLPPTVRLRQLSVWQRARKGGADLSDGNSFPRRLCFFLLFLMDIRVPVIKRVPKGRWVCLEMLERLGRATERVSERPQLAESVSLWRAISCGDVSLLGEDWGVLPRRVAASCKAPILPSKPTPKPGPTALPQVFLLLY